MKKLIVLLVLTLWMGLICGDECVNNRTKKNNCYYCLCLGGHWACSRNSCPPTTTPTTTTLSTTTGTIICTPGESFKKDCNTCKCNDDGTSAACTAALCIKEK
nr:serine protease inhibitor I/II-like [Onthophagus taurus]